MGCRLNLLRVGVGLLGGFEVSFEMLDGFGFVWALDLGAASSFHCLACHRGTNSGTIP